jgi:hypothetical protein
MMLAALTGTKFRGVEVEALVRSLPNAEPLELLREPDNKFDPNAVQVWARGVHIGYLKASQNKPVANWMDALRRARQAPVTVPAKLSLKDGGWPFVEVEL